MDDFPLPCILHWNQQHFVVCYRIRKRRNKYKILIGDPAGTQTVTYNEEEFKRCWISSREKGQDTGVALVLEPTPDFYSRRTKPD